MNARPNEPLAPVIRTVFSAKADLAPAESIRAQRLATRRDCNAARASPANADMPGCSRATPLRSVPVTDDPSVTAARELPVPPESLRFMGKDEAAFISDGKTLVTWIDELCELPLRPFIV